MVVSSERVFLLVAILVVAILTSCTQKRMDVLPRDGSTYTKKAVAIMPFAGVDLPPGRNDAISNYWIRWVSAKNRQLNTKFVKPTEVMIALTKNGGYSKYRDDVFALMLGLETELGWVESVCREMDVEALMQGVIRDFGQAGSVVSSKAEVNLGYYLLDCKSSKVIWSGFAEISNRRGLPILDAALQDTMILKAVDNLMVRFPFLNW